MFRLLSDGGGPAHASSEATAALRVRALHADAVELGIEPTERFPSVFGVVMDTSFDTGVATLLALAGGATSFYTSTGFALIGGGAHANVVRANQALLRMAELQRPSFGADVSDDPPPEGFVTIRLLTHGGRLAVTDQEIELGEGRSPVSPVFHAAHAVIAALREIHEAAEHD